MGQRKSVMLTFALFLGGCMSTEESVCDGPCPPLTREQTDLALDMMAATQPTTTYPPAGTYTLPSTVPLGPPCTLDALTGATACPGW